MKSIGLGAAALAALSLAAAERLLAQTNPERVDAVFAEWNRSDSPGCSLAVLQDDAVAYTRGYGMADLDHGIANTAATVFHVASVSKEFTAAAVALLAKEGKLSLDDPARKYVTELPDFGTPVTIRQLIHHQSGLRDQWDLLGLSGWRYSLDLITDDDVMSLVKRQKALNFPPGSKYLYSNTGFTLLSQIVKRVSGKSLREFTTERFFKPLGMSRTHFRDDHAELVPDIAYGYERAGNTYRLSVTNFDTVGATSLMTTAGDLAKWAQNFWTGKVLGREFLDSLQVPGVLTSGKKTDYAFGLSVGTYRGLRTVGHGGADAGYRANISWFPDQRFAVTILCNAAHAQPWTLSRKVADIYLAAQLQPEPVPEKEVEVAATDLQKLTGAFVSADGRDGARVLVREGKLGISSSTDERMRALQPLGKSRFRLGDSGPIFTFAADAARFTQTFEDEDPVVYERVAQFVPQAADLAQYAGAYTSEELEPVYRVEARSGALVVTTMKLPAGEALVPLGRDFFLNAEFGTVRFDRDKRGAVNGLTINTGRVLDLRFRKAPAVIRP